MVVGCLTERWILLRAERLLVSPIMGPLLAVCIVNHGAGAGVWGGGRGDGLVTVAYRQRGILEEEMALEGLW